MILLNGAIVSEEPDRTSSATLVIETLAFQRLVDNKLKLGTF